MLFGILTVISGIVEQTTLGAEEVGVLQAFMDKPEIPSFINPVGAVWALINIGWDYMQLFWDVLWFNYAFFQGQWLYVKYLVFMPVSISVIASLVFILRGVGNA